MLVSSEMAAAPLSLPFALLKAMRPKQWVKNLLLFAGFVFTVNERWQPFSPAMWTYLSRAAAAFALFSLVSSAVYLANDVIDVENDRQHPTKRNRPIASGALPVWLAVLVATLLVPACLLADSALALRSVVGALLAGSVVALVAVSRGVGMGDVKMAGVVGASVGGLDWRAPLVAVAIAAALAAAYGAATRQQRVAFGPALWLGWMSVLIGFSTGWWS